MGGDRSKDKNEFHPMKGGRPSPEFDIDQAPEYVPDSDDSKNSSSSKKKNGEGGFRTDEQKDEN